MDGKNKIIPLDSQGAEDSERENQEPIDETLEQPPPYQQNENQTINGNDVIGNSKNGFDSSTTTNTNEKAGNLPGVEAVVTEQPDAHPKGEEKGDENDEKSCCDKCCSPKCQENTLLVFLGFCYCLKCTCELLLEAME